MKAFSCTEMLIWCVLYRVYSMRMKRSELELYVASCINTGGTARQLSRREVTNDRYQIKYLYLLYPSNTTFSYNLWFYYTFTLIISGYVFRQIAIFGPVKNLRHTNTLSVLR
jgi:hypothetical protein